MIWPKVIIPHWVDAQKGFVLKALLLWPLTLDTFSTTKTIFLILEGIRVTFTRTASQFNGPALLLTAMMVLLSLAHPSPSLANVPGGGTGTGGNVTVTDNGGTVVLANGIVSFTINKSNGNLTNFTYNGTNLLAGGHGGGSYYFDGSGGPGLTNPVYTLTVNPASNGGNQAEVWLQSNADPMDMAIYYDLLRGQQGVYNTMILTHQAGYADYPGAELRSNMYVGSIFDWLCVDPYRFRQMAPPNTAVTTVAGAPPEVMQWTAGIYNGLTECKYAYSDPLGQLDTWGWASSTSSYGVWQVLPSHEYYDGGPMHRELTEHMGNTLLNMFGGGHYGFGSSGDQPAGTFSSKTFGPAFIYASKYAGPAGDPVSLKARVLWADAQAQAQAEQSAWPYTWFNPQPVAGMAGSAYPQTSGRGTVNGTLAINDPYNPGTSPVSLWIGLAPVDGGVDFQQQYLTYQFWVKTGAGGSFTIPKVLPGTYNLWAFGSGVVGTFEKTNVTLAAGQNLNLGTVTWTPLRLGPTVWDIGIPDRNSNEFRNGEHEVAPFSGVLPGYAGGAPHNTPADWGAFLDYTGEFPNGVSFVVGSSSYASDWNYCQPTVPNGSGGFTGSTSKIYFNLASAPSAAQTARLYIAFAAAYSSACILTINGTVQTASVMGSTNGNYAAIANPATGFFPPNYSFDSTVRLGSQGAWGDAYLDFAGTKLKAGMNEIDLGLRAAGGAGNGNSFEYDYLRLELTGFNSSNTPTKTLTPTLTPARTNTPTPTMSNTATRTATNTPSLTPSATATNTITNTAARTATATPTRTATPSSTNTQANTATNTPSRTPSNTPTNSSTATATRTASFSPSPTSTNTVGNTVTASATPTPSPTRTPSSTPSNSPTASATNTPTNSRTNTPVNTATGTPTHSPTATAVNTNTLTPTNTGTAQPSATASRTPTNSPTQTGTKTPTSTATNTQPASTNTPSNSPTATGTNTLVNTPTHSATRTPSNSPTPTGTDTATDSPTNTLTATPTPTASRTPSPTATASMTATLSLTASPTESPTRTPSSTPSNTAVNTNTPTPTATGTTPPTNTATMTPSNSPTGTATNSPTSTPTRTSTASPTLTGTKTATSTPTNSPTILHTNTATNTPTKTTTPTVTATASLSPTSTPTPAMTAGIPVLYPNPADGSMPVNLALTLQAPSDVRIRLFTVQFRKVKDAGFQQVPAGSSVLSFTLTDNHGTPLGNGLYYVVVDSSAGHQVLKLMVLR